MRRQGPNRGKLHLARVLRSQQFLQRGRARAKGSKTEQADRGYPVADRTLIVLSRDREKEKAQRKRAVLQQRRRQGFHDADRQTVGRGIVHVVAGLASTL